MDKLTLFNAQTMQLYRPMLKRALRLTWKFKYLWFFGLFSVLMGNGEAYNLGVRNFTKVESRGVWLADFRDFLSNFKFNPGGFNLYEAMAGVDMWGVMVITGIIALGVFFIWLAVSSQAALVYGISQAEKGKDGVFSEAFSKGSSKFWPVFLLNIILNVAIFALLVLVSLPFIIFYLGSAGVVWQTILIILSFIVLVPVAIVLSLIVRYALIYVVNEERHLAEALSKAWQLFAKNWIVSLEMGLLLFALNLLTGLALVVVMIFVALPFVMLGMLASQLASQGIFLLIVALGILTFIALMFLYAAMWNTFAMANWVMLFEKLKGGVVYSKILRWAVWLSAGGKREEKSGA